MQSSPICFIPFEADVSDISLPHRFTFPFYYHPHELCVIAANELQQRISNQKWDHNFGLDQGQSGMVIGKMFGVLVVKNKDGQLGYLAGFSGKIADENHHEGFVPPVYDILKKDGFFREEEQRINALNAEIERLEGDPNLQDLRSKLATFQDEIATSLAQFRQDIKQGKRDRKQQRDAAKTRLSQEEWERLDVQLAKESVHHQLAYKRLARSYREQWDESQKALDSMLQKIDALKDERRTRSGLLQKRLFDEYCFLNANGEWRSLLSIFHYTDQSTPPAGAGECAAPKLLQYAFLHQLEPIAMAEFWWGASPKSDVRKHRQFYPACRGKCEPILGHMLKGLEVDPNPMLDNPAEGKELEILFEDEFMMAVNKPAEFLSVPGKIIKDSVYSRIRVRNPEATGPLIVHRLDMSTSGILLIAKSKEIHKRLQHQFENRSIKKRYVALLDGEITVNSGEIDLPLRVDLDDRPRQLVCYEHGKPSKTYWELIETKNGQSKVYFYPLTGRTHQLRVHAAHQLGLNTPIVGDDLYGTIKDRLHLHAERIEFVHPQTKENMLIAAKVEF
jgi:tRNA pseudouridine32 synthase/23S rRNA pseudouridine746 synthase